MTIRPTTEADIPGVIQMGDDAVAWLVEQGRTGQWGTRPWSENPERAKTMMDRLTSTEFFVAEIGGRLAGALAVATHPQEYAPAIDEPELYVHFLITAGDFRGRNVGARLLDHARDRARELGIGLIRVDCYGGADRKLVAYYESQGFTPTAAFTVKDWPGQVLEQRLG
ncbi:GCN5 family N-acetyltransferase [Actinorhabdospora filicis]|uniref:GCN5 family N-acetyltransferase n=1 Tax=Actinorhabdospora filicis TaxID=1785913 RepID=A0A9W6SGX7_9ACTN|nr:GNAT family N-acetyltransferase [Actinorhabdospora filicis]GLZ75793.1 GCN5 family N-acetyltransferase [Actinorhabdospora filicis]